MDNSRAPAAYFYWERTRDLLGANPACFVNHDLPPRSVLLETKKEEDCSGSAPTERVAPSSGRRLESDQLSVGPSFGPFASGVSSTSRSTGARCNPNTNANPTAQIGFVMGSGTVSYG